MITYFNIIFLRPGGWRWRDGSPVEYTNWAPNNPTDVNGTSNLNCVKMDKRGLWFDARCSENQAFVCKTKQGK